MTTRQDLAIESIQQAGYEYGIAITNECAIAIGYAIGALDEYASYGAGESADYDGFVPNDSIKIWCEPCRGTGKENRFIENPVSAVIVGSDYVVRECRNCGGQGWYRYKS